jgi:hypothetical protein
LSRRSEPTGPALGRPDDRLRRLIQYSKTLVIGVLDTPLEPVIGLAEGETRWRSMTILCGGAASVPSPLLGEGQGGGGGIGTARVDLVGVGTARVAPLPNPFPRGERERIAIAETSCALGLNCSTISI